MKAAQLKTAPNGRYRAFLMITFWESEEAIRAFAGDDISVAKYYAFDKDFLLELESCSTQSHNESNVGLVDC